MSGDRVRVLIYATVSEAEPEGISQAYHRISTALAGTPGLLGNELMRSVIDDSGFVVMSEWRDLAAFRQWEAGPDHRAVTAPLRSYQDASRGSPFGIYTVIADYGGEARC